MVNACPNAAVHQQFWIVQFTLSMAQLLVGQNGVVNSWLMLHWCKNSENSEEMNSGPLSVNQLVVTWVMKGKICNVNAWIIVHSDAKQKKNIVFFKIKNLFLKKKTL